MDLFIWQYVFLFFMVGLAGFIDSMVGGGGLITIPTYLALGVPAELILGTNKCVSTTGGTIAIARFIKNKAINFKLLKFAVITGLIGSIIGATLSRHLENHMMIYILLFISPIVLFLNYKRSKIRLTNSQSPTISSEQMILRTSLIGFFIGGYDGFFGPGTGIFLIFAFIYFLNFSIVEASPNARIINYASNLAAFIYFLVKGAILWKVAFVAILGSMTGNYLGSGQVLKGNTKILTIIFNVVLVSLLAKSIFDIFIK